VNRIGLEHSKRFGTSEDGHRHGYGFRLEDAEIHPTIIQKAMHHRSQDSQEAYKEWSKKDIQDVFLRGERVLKEKRKSKA